jgi:N-methylhydantoinase B/oxoprolinase/acetone carboxylase alpha subunit
VREYEFLAPVTVTVNSERRIIAPYGLQGGEAGTRGVNHRIREGEDALIGGKWSGQALPGDRFVIETPGGGGWGAP